MMEVDWVPLDDHVPEMSEDCSVPSHAVRPKKRSVGWMKDIMMRLSKAGWLMVDQLVDRWSLQNYERCGQNNWGWMHAELIKSASQPHVGGVWKHLQGKFCRTITSQKEQKVLRRSENTWRWLMGEMQRIRIVFRIDILVCYLHKRFPSTLCTYCQKGFKTQSFVRWVGLWQNRCFLRSRPSSLLQKRIWCWL